MRPCTGRIALGALLAIAACSDDDNGTQPPGPSPCVPLTFLPTLGGTESEANAINEAGAVAGASALALDSAWHAVVWRGDEMIDLGTLGGSFSTANAINAAGHVVGRSSLAGNPVHHAFVWRNGVMTDLGTLGGSWSEARDVNDAGWIVGHSTLRGDSVTHAFLWRDGAMSDLGTLGGRDSEANAVSETGQIVGWSTAAADGAQHAFLWRGGVLTDLGPGVAHDVNDAGHVVGRLDGPGPWSAFVWRDGVTTDLGVFGGDAAVALAIDRFDRVVGRRIIGAFVPQAFAWEDGVVTDLATIDPRLTSSSSTARRLNGAGQVVGSTGGADADDPHHALLWDLNCVAR